MKKHKHNRPHIRPPCRIAVIGDVHGHVEEARQRLEAIEASSGPIDAVFQIGDFMLATRREDWASISTGKGGCDPALSEGIAAAWEAWKWPTLMIGGNHDAFGRLRRFRPKEWGGKLTYGNAGILQHPVQGLRVIGLSGIYSSGEYDKGFGGPAQSGGVAPDSWEALLAQKEVNRKRLTYYRQTEVEHVLSLPKHPHILMTHDWPIRAANHKGADQPHFQLLPALEPDWAFAGHLHHYTERRVGRTSFIGLGDIEKPVEEWCVLMHWDGRTLTKTEN
jgi:predicted phosphodiesterase